MTDNKPGYMIYFQDWSPMFSELTDEELGKLLRASAVYAKTGEEPHWKDRYFRLAWGVIKARLDADDSNYQGVVNKRSYATYCREMKKAGKEPAAFDVWSASHTSNDDCEHQKHQMISNDDCDNQKHQMISNASNTNSNSNFNSNINTNSNSIRETKGRTPSLDAVKNYVEAKKYSFDPERFFNYYEATDWKIHGAAVKNWKRLADNWETQERKPPQTTLSIQQQRQGELQKHGEALSPLMRQAVEKLLAEEDDEACIT